MITSVNINYKKHVCHVSGQHKEAPLYSFCWHLPHCINIYYPTQLMCFLNSKWVRSENWMKGSSTLQMISSFALRNFRRNTASYTLTHSCAPPYGVGKVCRENSRATSSVSSVCWTECEQTKRESTYIEIHNVDHLQFLPLLIQPPSIACFMYLRCFSFTGGRKWKDSRIIPLWFLNESSVGIFIPGVCTSCKLGDVSHL